MSKAPVGKPKLVLIAPTSLPHVTETEERDRAGGQEHGKIMDTLKSLVGISADPVDLGEKLREQVAALGPILGGAATTIKGYELHEVSVSIAITAEGSIGIATAGIEGSIALKFARKP